jgi:hypothetical protein
MSEVTRLAEKDDPPPTLLVRACVHKAILSTYLATSTVLVGWSGRIPADLGTTPVKELQDLYELI